MEKLTNTCDLATWKMEYARELAEIANNLKVKRYLRDAFPHPYALKDAQDFIAKALKAEDGFYFCIQAGGNLTGSISVRPRADVERFSGEIGYFIAEEYWGRGIATEAIRAMTHIAIKQYGLHRLFALIDAPNQASARACEKAGYTFEARLKDAVFKNDQFYDQMIYAFVDSND
jgi:ribosomal-protein-alanine N-acetyltransferase